MIQLPDFNDPFCYENGFFLTCDHSRIAKHMAQYELFSRTAGVEGSIIECGVFKGISLIRFAHFRRLLGLEADKTITGFDTFGEFPPSAYGPDNNLLEEFLTTAGSSSISRLQLKQVLERKALSDNIELIEGDILETIPAFVADNPGLRISFLNLDVDLYEPSKVILKHLWPLMSPGGIMLLDDYAKFPGETKAADDYFSGTGIEIRQYPGVTSPWYVVKE